MAARYWAGGTGTWNTSSTANWSAATALTFTASCSGTTLTTVGSPALVAGMTVWSSTYVSLGTVVSGAANSWVVSIGGTYGSQAMQAATIGASVPTATDSVIFDKALTYTVTCTGALACLDITVSAGTVTFAQGTSPTFAISGSMSLVAGTVWSATGAITFNATTTGKTITTNGVSISSSIVFNGVGGAWTIGTAFTTSNPTTLTNGTLALSTLTYTTSTFVSSNSNTRTISFGTGNIVCSGTGTVWSFGNSTNLTITGTPVVNVTSVGSTAITVNSDFISEASAVSFNFTGGTYALTFLGSTGFTAKNVSFTGFAGTWNAIGSCNVYGNLTLSTGMTLTASTSTLNLRATSGTQTVTSNGKTMDFPFTVVTNSTVVFADALTLGSTRSLGWVANGANCIIKFTSGTTNTVGNFTDVGDTTLKYLQSTVPGSQATISCAGTVTITTASIKDSNATGGAFFDATSSGNINAGNNTGWTFGSGTSNFFFLFN